MNKNLQRIKCKSEISLWKNPDSFKEHEQKIKTWIGNSTGNADKKSAKTGKNNQRKNVELCWNKKEKAAQEELTI